MDNWKCYMLESNQIEGEDRLNPGDKEAFDFATTGFLIEGHILHCHHVLTEHLKVNWSGLYRTCNVRVGNYLAPKWQDVPRLMEEFVKKLPDYNSWQAYCEFEKIHPFRDRNGRVGRLIWLSKKLKEGWNFGNSFLEQFHYDSLSNYRK